MTAVDSDPGSLVDLVLTKTNAVILGLLALAGAMVKQLVAWKRELSDLRLKVAKDNSTAQVLGAETAVQIGWLRGMVERSERDARKIVELEAEIKGMNETRINDARALSKRDAELTACHERVAEMRLERDLAEEDRRKVLMQLAAALEHSVVVDGMLVNYRVANLRLFTAMPKEMQEQLREHLLKQEPPPNPEPPKL